MVELSMNKIFSKKHLLQALKNAGLPASYPTLLAYEKAGVVPHSEGNIEFADRRWRFYTEEEITNIIIRVKGYLDAKKTSQKNK